MAGDWIKVEHTLPDKPEIDRLAGILSIDHDAITGKLLRLWIWADQNTIDGNAVSVTKSLLDRIALCQGFAEAMKKVGWLKGTDGKLSFPHFDRHNGKTAKNRALCKNRVENSRNDRSVTKSLPDKNREDSNVCLFVQTEHLHVWPDARRLANDAARKLWPGRTGLPKPKEQRLLLVAAFLSKTVLSEDWFNDAITVTVKKRPEIKKTTYDYIMGVWRNSAAERNHDFDGYLKTIQIPPKEPPTKPLPEASQLAKKLGVEKP